MDQKTVKILVVVKSSLRKVASLTIKSAKIERKRQPHIKKSDGVVLLCFAMQKSTNIDVCQTEIWEILSETQDRHSILLQPKNRSA